MNIIDQAKQWRQESNKKTGYVVFENTKIAGWIRDLHQPQNWKPLTRCISENNQIFIASGGNDHDGANNWVPK